MRVLGSSIGEDIRRAFYAGADVCVSFSSTTKAKTTTKTV